jgi:hypothetical protein
MMSKGPIARFFDLGSRDLPPQYAQTLAGQPRVPTLDERASLYLRAVHGERDFTSEQYSDARSLILDEMAADIATKSQMRLLEKAQESSKTARRDPDTTKAVGILAELSNSPSFQRSFKSEDALSERFSELSVRYEYESSRASIELAHLRGVIPESRWSKRRRVTRSIFICGGAVAACLVALVSVKVLPTVWFPANPNSTVLPRAAVQLSLSPSEQSGAAAVQLEQSSAASLSSPQAEPARQALVRPLSRGVQVEMLGQDTASTHQLDPEAVTDLVKRGQELIAAGKIPAARLVLMRAAEAGDAPAAMALGTTYDPIELEKLGFRDADPDIAMARFWYQKAKELGSIDAPARLESLAARDGRPR